MFSHTKRVRRGKTLRQAVYENDLALCKSMLKSGVDPNECSRHGKTPLMWASYKDSLSIVKLLLNHPDIDVNARNDDKNTALSIASWWSRENVVKMLLDRPEINVNDQGSEGETALMVAAQNNYSDIVKQLLAHSNIGINIRDHYGETALMYALDANHYDIAKLLIAHGSDIPKRNATYWALGSKAILKNWKSFLPPFKRFSASNKYYPRKFKHWAFNFVLCCVRDKTFYKDLIYLLLEYVAKAWKHN